MGNAVAKAVPDIMPKKLRYESLKTFDALTETQAEVFSEYNKGKNLILHGYAGTGKTFLALYLAIKEVLLRESDYEKVVVVRSTVPTRDQGFLPGSVEEKELIYQQPYHAIFKEIFYDQDAITKLVHQDLYQFISTSYIRGITLRNAIVIIDEGENMGLHELDSVITRLGDSCKLIMCGDFRQSDLTKESEKNGIKTFMNILDKVSDFSHIEFMEDDIVRSKMVREYIIAKTKMGL